jgi:hypothetical protein
MMAREATRRISFPDSAGVIVASGSKEALALRAALIEAGTREWWEPVDAKDQIRAAHVLRETAGYLIELAAGASPGKGDARSLEQVRALIAEALGYVAPASEQDPQEAPLTAEEHTPPVVN